MNSTQTLRIGLVGVGKIAVDQHIPAIRANPQLELVAGTSRHAGPDGLPIYTSMEEMLARHPEISAVALCTPPQVRRVLAGQAIAAGKHVFLEKPPAATLGEAEAMRALAAQRGVTLFASWHSRFAPGVQAAAEWMTQHKVRSLRVEWKENVRQWHPGQKWIFEPGGMGVFDPGINALSIVTRLLGGPLLVQQADLHIPSNCSAPIQAELRMESAQGVAVSADFDFLQTGQQTWSIFAEAEGGARMALHQGGRILELDGQVVADQPEREYASMYQHFRQLVAEGRSDADFTPLQAVADAFLAGRLHAAAPFVE